MFKGKAELTDPETGAVVATFTEHGKRMDVVLKEPLTISGTTRLALHDTLTDAELLSVVAKDGQDTTVRRFHGVSAVGVLADNSEISLTRTPGGPLGTLLIVLGTGIVHRDHHQ